MGERNRGEGGLARSFFYRDALSAAEKGSVKRHQSRECGGNKFLVIQKNDGEKIRKKGGMKMRQSEKGIKLPDVIFHRNRLEQSVRKEETGGNKKSKGNLRHYWEKSGSPVLISGTL